MIVLGINGVDGLFHDASASIIVNNQIMVSVEEERFNRRKHSDGIPWKAINYCLEKCKIGFEDIDSIGYYLDPQVLKTFFVDQIVDKNPKLKGVLNYYTHAAERITKINSLLQKRFGNQDNIKFHYINHHLAHAASTYYISKFKEAAILTIDGAGDKETLTVFSGIGHRINKVTNILEYPKSLGFIYTVLSNHLGLGWIEGPGKLMGLAGYGKADKELFKDIIHLKDDPSCPIDIDLSYFDYHVGGKGLSEKGKLRFGISRLPDEPLEQRHKDLAASVQFFLEKSVCHIVSKIPVLLPEQKNLCVAGGIGLNVCCNRKILDTGYFKKIFITPPAYDGGTSLGCALYLNSKATKFHNYEFSAYLGPDIAEDFNIEDELIKHNGKLKWIKLNDLNMCKKAAEIISKNKIVGWVQGRMECGPRALGNRSFLTNPMNPKAKDLLNGTVKKREPFRPYAPSVMQEFASDWFDIDESPYMLYSANVLSEKRHLIPGVVHVDGTARPQTVSNEDNKKFHSLLNEFYKITGVPILLNTSFNNHGDPIVNSPKDAIDVLLNTELTALFMDDIYVTKKD